MATVSRRVRGTAGTGSAEWLIQVGGTGRSQSLQDTTTATVSR
jgi:hypothetical protein